MTLFDTIAIILFLVAWVSYDQAVSRYSSKGQGLSGVMNIQRAAWMRAMLSRDLRMIDQMQIDVRNVIYMNIWTRLLPPKYCNFPLRKSRHRQ